MATTARLDRGDGVRLAFAHTQGRGPLLVFLPGYLSDMAGTKAMHLEAWAEASGRAFLRFDYSGCGASDGDFAAGSIRRWAADALAVIDHVAPGETVLPVGSSMGGWIMLHLALSLGPRLAGLVGIAAAPDFTRWGLALSAEDRAALEQHGFVIRPSSYGPEPYRYHAALLDDAAHACLLDDRIAVDAPVRLLHGTADAAVPWEVSLRLMRQLGSRDVRLTLVKDGDHRLSAPAELSLLTRTIEELLP
jgi:pimeloyl-ACP methyl ester carboxylesterase